MSKNQGNANYNKFESLVDQFRGVLSENKIKEVEYLVEHDEVEMAFETLCWMVSDNRLELSVLLINALKEMFDELNTAFIEEHWKEIKLITHLNLIKIKN